jgi:hypothetical protein
MKPFPLGLAFAALLSPAVADQVPRLDIEKTCRAVAGTPVDKAKIQTCIEAEKKVRQELADNWTRYSAASRAQCSSGIATAYHATYVELVSFLEMANPGAGKPKPAN